MDGAEVWLDTPDDWNGYDNFEEWTVIAMVPFVEPDDGID